MKGAAGVVCLTQRTFGVRREGRCTYVQVPGLPPLDDRVQIDSHKRSFGGPGPPQFVHMDGLTGVPVDLTKWTPCTSEHWTADVAVLLLRRGVIPRYRFAFWRWRETRVIADP